MAILIYFVKVVAISGLLYGYYHLFLRNKLFHHYNRFYLLLVALLSFIIPFLQIPVFLGGRPSTGLIKTLTVINVTGWEEPVTIYSHQNNWMSWLTLQNGLYIGYATGLLAGLFLLMRSLVYIRQLKKRYRYEMVDQLKIYSTAEPGTPFSFFRSIFWDNKLVFNNPQGQQIFRHELFHVKEKHSADILLLEIICCMAWFNPFFYLIKKELKAIHEFLADDYAASGNNRYDYAELLVLHAIQQKTPSITHPFFHNQIKRRITMITQSNLVRRSGYISRVMALPLLFLLASAFAVKLTNKPSPKSSAHLATKKLTVVVDAGHGGRYMGAQGHNFMEKDIALGISQEIKKLSGEYNVNVILTRNSDQLVGNASTLSEDLANRATIANDSKSDLLISIHVNSSQIANVGSGFDAYISKRNDKPADKVIASAILTSIKDLYTVNNNIKQREIGIRILDKSNCPSVLLGCGNINNAKDVAFITDKNNQEKIARKILEGIVEYGNAADNFIGTTSNEPVQTIIFNKANDGQADGMLEKVKFTKNDTVPGNKIFTKVENEAEYPGGQAGWSAYLFKTINYPQIAQDKEIKGTVVVQFIVDENGKISNVKAISGPKELRAESVRVIKESGTWNSAKQSGKNVKSYKKQPITYKLEQQG